MKKSINRFSIAMWIIAGFYLIITASSFALLTSVSFTFPKTQGDHAVIGSMLWTIPSGILYTSLLAAFGYIIELLDQIRWSLRAAHSGQ